MKFLIPNAIDIRKLTYRHNIKYSFIGFFVLMQGGLVCWIGIKITDLFHNKNISDLAYIFLLAFFIFVFKVILYFLLKEFGYDFWGKLQPKQYQEYVCKNCLNNINEDSNEDIFVNSVKKYGWKNISFANENYSFIQIQYLLDLLLDNTYNDKTIKDIVEEYIVPMLSRYKNRKDIINLILQHAHLSIKRLDKEENMEVYLLLYSSCLKLQLEDTLSTTECNLCNFVNSFERRQKLSSLLVLSQYNLCRPVLSKVDAIILKSRRQDINSSSSAIMATMEDFK